VSQASPLPLAVRFALWFSAWAAGTSSLDDARDGIIGDDAAHDVIGLPGRLEPEPVIFALGALRGLGATAATVALPAPGDPLGLAGPAAFNVEVLEVGEGVVLEGSGVGLVPHRTGAGVTWTCHPAAPARQLPSSGEADQSLRRALLGASTALAGLDVAKWRPEVADELMALRRHRSTSDYALPGQVPADVVRLAVLAVRCRTIVDLALVDDGGSITAAEADARRRALLPLDQAARRALVAVGSTASWPS
jgi:hypothetical protein